MSGSISPLPAAAAYRVRQAMAQRVRRRDFTGKRLRRPVPCNDGTSRDRAPVAGRHAV